MLLLAVCVRDDELGERLTIRQRQVSTGVGGDMASPDPITLHPSQFAAFSQRVNGGPFSGVVGMLHMDQLSAFFRGGWPSGGRWRTETYGEEDDDGRAA